MSRETVIAPVNELNIEKTFECGQCFRWNAGPDGVYRGIAYGYPAAVYEQDGAVIVRSDAPDSLWHDYFDMDLNYTSASVFGAGEYLDSCVERGKGIRILRQEPWEALCSFIISQCNNIPRIKGIVERLCREFGNPVSFEGSEFFTFPSAETLSNTTEDDLAVIRSGYRAEYIICAAKAVCSGELDLGKLMSEDWESAKKDLLSIRGVGEKVANCVVLFGLHHMEAFPIDVWIRRALKEHFPKDFRPESLGPYAGLAQQYIFYSARSLESK